MSASKIDPILREIPVPVVTPRLMIRNPLPGDGAIVNPAIKESMAALTPWMPWAQTVPSLEDSEVHARRSYAKWILREDLSMLIFEKSTGEFVGGSGLHRIKWDVPAFEIGYWCRSKFTGQGFIQESTNAITRFAFGALGAKRVEIRCDSRNKKSISVIERLGFPKEGSFTSDSVDAISGLPRNSFIYARTNLDGMPDLQVRWG